MQRTYQQRLSRRVKHSISLLLCACIVVSTVISTALAASTSLRMPATLSANAHTNVHAMPAMADHVMTEKSIAKHHPTSMNDQHNSTCDNCDHDGKSDCPEGCIANLCCTAPGLSSFTNSLQLYAPNFPKRYLTLSSSRLPPQQSSLVLRPPIA